MRVLLLVLLCVSLCPAAWAGDGPTLPEVRLDPRAKLLQVSIVPADGSHLAEDLPLIVRLEDGYFDFQTAVQEVPKAGPARVLVPLFKEKRIVAWTLKVEGAACSDDGTTCVPFHLEQTIERGVTPLRGRHRAVPGRLARPAPPEPPERVPREGETAGPKPILYDFFATWCPPCDRLRDEFLEHPDWADVVAGYNVVSLDADAPESFAMKDRFRVGGYPTVILTSPQGDILERISGFPGAAEVARRLAAATSPSAVEGCARSVDEMRLAAARRETEEAWRLLHAGCEDPLKALTGSPSNLMTAFEIAKKLEHTDDAIALGALFARTTDDLGMAAWIADSTADLLDGADRGVEAQGLRDLLITRIDEGVEEASGDPDVAIELANALWYRGGWSPEEKPRYHADAARLLEGAILGRAGQVAKPGLPLLDAVLALGERLHEHEGLIHDLIDLLASAGDHDAAGLLLDAMLALEPDGFTWHNAKAAWLQEREMLPEALASARRALEGAYGDNRLRAAKRVAALLGPGDEALAVIDEALSAPEPEHEHVRTWKYRQRLQTLRDELAPSEAKPR